MNSGAISEGNPVATAQSLGDGGLLRTGDSGSRTGSGKGLPEMANGWQEAFAAHAQRLTAQSGDAELKQKNSLDAGENSLPVDRNTLISLNRKGELPSFHLDDPRQSANTNQAQNPGPIGQVEFGKTSALLLPLDAAAIGTHGAAASYGTAKDASTQSAKRDRGMTQNEDAPQSTKRRQSGDDVNTATISPVALPLPVQGLPVLPDRVSGEERTPGGRALPQPQGFGAAGVRQALNSVSVEIPSISVVDRGGAIEGVGAAPGNSIGRTDRPLQQHAGQEAAVSGLSQSVLAFGDVRSGRLLGGSEDGQIVAGVRETQAINSGSYDVSRMLPNQPLTQAVADPTRAVGVADKSASAASPMGGVQGSGPSILRDGGVEGIVIPGVVRSAATSDGEGAAHSAPKGKMASREVSESGAMPLVSAHLGPGQASVLPASASVSLAISVDASETNAVLNGAANSNAPVASSRQGLNPFDLIDGGTAHGVTHGVSEASITHAGAAGELQMGYQDPDLGYIELRAQTSRSGIHASLGTESATTGAALEGHLNSLTGWMSARQTPVESLTILPPGTSVALQANTHGTWQSDGSEANGTAGGFGAGAGRSGGEGNSGGERGMENAPLAGSSGAEHSAQSRSADLPLESGVLAWPAANKASRAGGISVLV